MYEYKAEITNVVDGDTVDAKIYLGFYITADIRLRVARINTPELNRRAERVDGLAAKDWLIAELAKVDNKVTIATNKTGKYGRWIAEIYTRDKVTNFNDALVKSGHAEYVDY